jgi:hypothetical protein
MKLINKILLINIIILFFISIEGLNKSKFKEINKQENSISHLATKLKLNENLNKLEENHLKNSNKFKEIISLNKKKELDNQISARNNKDFQNPKKKIIKFLKKNQNNNNNTHSSENNTENIENSFNELDNEDKYNNTELENVNENDYLNKTQTHNEGKDEDKDKENLKDKCNNNNHFSNHIHNYSSLNETEIYDEDDDHYNHYHDHNNNHTTHNLDNEKLYKNRFENKKEKSGLLKIFKSNNVNSNKISKIKK